MSDEPDKVECNDGHYFELLDRVHIASSYVQMALGDHPVLAEHADLQKLYRNAVEQLEALFHAIGQHEKTWK